MTMESSKPDINLPAIRFLGCDRWGETGWSGTTFRWHPAGEAPPVMGLVFDDDSAGQSIFNEWVALAGNQDPYEELRVTIIEGEIADTQPEYIVLLCPDPANTLVHATAEGASFDIEQISGLCRANKMDFLPDSPPMLPRFKEECAKHGEFLLAPVTRRDDGQMYFDVNLGIVKKKIEFRSVEGILAELKGQGIDVEAIAKMLAEQAVLQHTV